MAEHYVYVYRTPAGVPVYVGYGHQAQRAISHRGNSHNADLRAWLNKSNFDLQIAGPYRDEAEAKAVESALISALAPKFNRSPGDGPSFVPLGVPAELSARVQMDPLTLSKIGKLAQGALIVYLAPGDYLKDGRRKYDAAQPTDDDAVANIERSWDIGPLQEHWKRYPSTAPRTLIGVHGKPQHRFIVGALTIDRSRIGEPGLERTADRWSTVRWQVPLVDRSDLDAGDLRGRRVEGVTFGQFSHQLHIWVDRSGRVRHPAS
jgi:hypothetical protein